jgi:hypothetical protein
MEVLDIVKAWLTDNNFDGLFSDGGECACLISNLQPCGENFSDCGPGIKKTWNEMTEDQQSMCESGCDFYILKK